MLSGGGATNGSVASAPAQAGVLEGMNPATYNPKDPIILFIIQASIIIIFSRILYWPLRYLGQPRVIAEVVGGIILGPSVMARIPGFREAIFPTASMPVLANVANLGLIIFMFITALEVDLGLFVENWRVAMSVSFAGMIIPFGLGCAIAVGIYNQFAADMVDDINFAADMVHDINFGVFALFVGTALAITAFPVLCRILTELKLLGTSVGVTVLAAGVGNDVVGWILLALCVSLVNNASGLAALYALLCCLGWILLLVYAVRPAFIWVLKRSGSLQDGPSPGMVTLTLLLVLASSFFTGIIGVHPIFGGFLVGLICPHDGGFAIKLTQKIEDFVGVLFLPLYFALSGLNTNIGLLNDGMVWGYVVAVIVIAFSGKIIGGTLAARFCGLLWRESASIGVLMSCKGLVELIVLNIGLQAGILSQRTFTMFVIMALVTTVATTPLTKLLYPPWYQKKLERWRRGEIDWDGNLMKGDHGESSAERLDAVQQVRRVLVYLRLDSLPSLFTFIALLGGTTSTDKTEPEGEEKPTIPTGTATATTGGGLPPPASPLASKGRPLEVHGLRMLELTDRSSSVMQVTEGTDLAESDPIVNAFRAFSQLHGVAVSGQVAIVPTYSYAETLTTTASDMTTDFVLIPWSNTGSIAEDQFAPCRVSLQERFEDRVHLEFVNQALQTATCNAGVFINNGFGGGGVFGVGGLAKRPALSRNISRVSVRSAMDHKQPTLLVTDRRHHVFFPFIGGTDDRVALRFVLQLAKNPLVTVTITHISWTTGSEANDEGWGEEEAEGGDNAPHPGSPVKPGALPDSTSRSSGPSNPTSVDATGSAEAGNNGAAAATEEDYDAQKDAAVLSAARSSMQHSGREGGTVTFSEVRASSANQALRETRNLAAKTVGKQRKKNAAGDIIIVGRSHASLGDHYPYYLPSLSPLPSRSGNDRAVGPPPAANIAAGATTGGSGTGAMDLRGTLGLIGEQLVMQEGVDASLLVVQAAKGLSER